MENYKIKTVLSAPRGRRKKGGVVGELYSPQFMILNPYPQKNKILLSPCITLFKTKSSNKSFVLF